MQGTDKQIAYATQIVGKVAGKMDQRIAADKDRLTREDADWLKCVIELKQLIRDGVVNYLMQQKAGDIIDKKYCVGDPEYTIKIIWHSDNFKEIRATSRKWRDNGTLTAEILQYITKKW